ncbi:uncharacterized protein LOC133202788 isoform X2 [Saccostrea echinata]|uniref:uncharacterized protein LOC133202788 isoform X2 n=1 Tax=Saccostrea echinata TaxID=191078 RepID=UPI002A7F78B6|nr:uncharacterized protein LOC133202788 isoform X2 [Saccostrea echinata]
MESVVVISDDEESEDEKFEADLELARRLSLQEHFQKKKEPLYDVSHSAVQKFVKSFKSKFNQPSTSGSSCSTIIKQEELDNQPPRKVLKLEGGHCSVARPENDHPIYEVISDDDLPDLEEEDSSSGWWKTEKVKTEDEHKKEVVLDSPESPPPESQQFSTPLRYHLEPIRVPLYEDISSDEDYEEISKENNSSIIVLSEDEENCTIVIDSQDESVQEKPTKFAQDESVQETPAKFAHHKDSPFKKIENQQETVSSSGSPSAPSSPGVENFFNKNTKKKLADILKRVSSSKSLNSSNPDSPPPRTHSRNSLSSAANQNERHFLDILDNTEPETDGMRDSKSNLEDRIKQNVKVGKLRNRRNVRVRRQTQEISEKPSQEKASTSGPCVLEVLKPLRISILSDDVNETLSNALSNLHVNTINSCFEEGTAFLDQGLQFIHDYLDRHTIPINIFLDIVIKGLLESRDTQIMLKSYKILLLIHEKNPDVFSKIEWDVLKAFMKELSIGGGLSNQVPLILHMVGLFLKVLIMTFEEELHSIDLRDPRKLRQTKVYKTLSYDCGYLNLKELVNWIRCSITSGEYPEVQDAVYLRQLVPDQDLKDLNLKRQEVPKILPLMQKLLSLGISVSSSPLECAKLVSSELLRTYIYLTSIKHKRLLIETICSNILRFRLISLVLLSHCEETFEPGSDVPQDLRSIYECYYCALPPRYSPLTPPTTPQSDEENESAAPQVAYFSPIQVEELAMILYFVTQSYLQCKKRKGHNTARRKAVMSKAELNSLPREDEKDLKQLPAQVEELRGHLLTLTSDLTEPTQVYLNLLLCLC